MLFFSIVTTISSLQHLHQWLTRACVSPPSSSGVVDQRNKMGGIICSPCTCFLPFSVCDLASVFIFTYKFSFAILSHFTAASHTFFFWLLASIYIPFLFLFPLCLGSSSLVDSCMTLLTWRGRVVLVSEEATVASFLICRSIFAPWLLWIPLAEESHYLRSKETADLFLCCTTLVQRVSFLCVHLCIYVCKYITDSLPSDSFLFHYGWVFRRSRLDRKYK